MSDYLTPEQVAERLDVTRYWLMRKAAAHEIPHSKVGRYVRFEEPDVAAIKASFRVDTGAASNPHGRKGRKSS